MDVNTDNNETITDTGSVMTVFSSVYFIFVVHSIKCCRLLVFLAPGVFCFMHSTHTCVRKYT